MQHLMSCAADAWQQDADFEVLQLIATVDVVGWQNWLPADGNMLSAGAI
jgi:hypothetical protein